MTRVAIVDDHPIMRDGLVAAIQKTTEAISAVEIVAAVGSVAELDAMAIDVDVILLDLGLPGLSGIAAIEHFVEQGYRDRILIMSAQTDRDTVLGALTAGAVGYVSKDADSDDLVYALRTAAQRRTYVSPVLAHYLLQFDHDKTEPRRLTTREREILTLLAQGYIAKEIGARLSITERTVSTHLDRIREKTNAHRKADLVRLAYQEGLVKDSE